MMPAKLTYLHGSGKHSECFLGDSHWSRRQSLGHCDSDPKQWLLVVASETMVIGT
jgi:hypothetical protein